MRISSLLAAAAIAASFTGFTTSARAADFGGASEPSQYCYLMRRSPILDLATQEEMERAVEDRYAHALDVSLKHTTIYSRSPRFDWSTEAKAACGIAVGFFNGREVNEDAISKCDCYYGRMLRFIH